MTVRVLLCPPLFFAQGRKWVSFVINGVLYTFCLFSIVAGLYWLIGGTEVGAAAFFFAGLFWLFSLAHVADARRREKARARTEPPASAWKGILKGFVYIAIPVVLVIDMHVLLEPSPSQTPEARVIELARLEAQLAVEQALQYQRAQGRNPGSLADLNAGVSGAGIEETDPWGRPWVVSPAFQDTRTPPTPGDLWICSRGPAGTGPCPPEDIARYAGPLHGSVGYSARFGPWPGSAGWGVRLKMAVISLVIPLPWVLAVGYVVGYPVYVIGALGSRLVRRLRMGKSSQTLNPLRPVLRDLWVICLVTSIWAAIAVPSLVTRAPAAKAQTDARMLASAVAGYEAHMGSLPTALTDLTREVTNSRGETARFVDAIPSPPRGFTRYHYRVRADGTFTISSFGITSAGERRTISIPETESPSSSLERGK